ncbi:MAG: ABC transporter permease [Eubacteriales bacterium]|nr:ABC transporter permease [Eubacteriales bacterium]
MRTTLRLYAGSLKQNLRQRGDLFWSLLFPLILGTLFFASFGSGVNLEEMSAVPAALVSGENIIFQDFLESMDGQMLKLSEMTKEQAKESLREGSIKGIFYAQKEPTLTVAGSNLEESILETLLDSYLEHQDMMIDISKHHLAGLPAAIAEISDYREMTESVTVSGRTMDDTVVYFYALIGMACLFGSFMGCTASMNMRADQSALAARRCVSPSNRLSMVISEMMACFTVQFLCVCVLLVYLNFVLGITFGEKWLLLLPVCILGSMAGVSIGMFIGSMKIGYGTKMGVLVSASLVMSFMAGLMFGNMKDIIEHHCPVLNRINPAALIADAFYSISVYDNPARYRMNLVILAGMTVLLTAVSFWMIRRERYESL